MSPALEENYGRLGLGRRWRRAKGFRLCAGKYRFSVRRLRAKLLKFLGLVGRHVRQLANRLATSSTRGSSPCPRSGSTRALVGQRRYSKSQGGEEAAAKKASRRAASFMRTNSFYAQAVADCLEFIKRNSVPMEDYGSPVIVAGPGR
jgi:hypothetical protein